MGERAAERVQQRLAVQKPADVRGGEKESRHDTKVVDLASLARVAVGLFRSFSGLPRIKGSEPLKAQFQGL